MTAAQQFIEDAIKGGWNDGDTMAIWHINNPHQILLDPLAWQAVGKTRGWQKNQCFARFRSTMMKIYHGKTIDEALSSLV